MASPITSVAVLAATDNEMNWIASYKEILGFQLRKVPAVEAEELGSSPFTEVQNFFHPLCSAWRFYCHTPMCSFIQHRKQNRNFVHCVQFTVFCSNLSLRWHELSQTEEIPRPLHINRAKRLPSSLQHGFLCNSFTISLGWFLPQLCKEKDVTNPRLSPATDSFPPLVNIRLLIFLIMAITTPIKTTCWLWRTGSYFPQVLILEASGDYVNLWARNKHENNINHLLKACGGQQDPNILQHWSQPQTFRSAE